MKIVMLMLAVFLVGIAVGAFSFKPAKQFDINWAFAEFYVEDGKLVILMDRQKVSPDWLVYKSGWMPSPMTGTFDSFEVPDENHRQYRQLTGMSRKGR